VPMHCSQATRTKLLRAWLLQIEHLFPRIERREHRREIAHALLDTVDEAITLLCHHPRNAEWSARPLRKGGGDCFVLRQGVRGS
jgi:hypothetical protein